MEYIDNDLGKIKEKDIIKCIKKRAITSYALRIVKKKRNKGNNFFMK